MKHDILISLISSHTMLVLKGILMSLFNKFCCINGVMPDSHLGNTNGIFHHINKNNQLERQVWPSKDVLLDA